MSARTKIAIYGAGGFAREVAWLVSSLAGADESELVAFVEDGAPANKSLNDYPVVSLEKLATQHPDASIVVAVGDPLVRRKLARRSSEAGFEFATLVHQGVAVTESTHISSGSIVCCGSILTVDIAIAEHVHVNLNCTIGHDVKIGAYTTISPGVNVSGNVHIGEGVFIGTGASIVNGTSDDPIVLGDGCVIGAGACVTANTEPRALYVGVPARKKKELTV